MPENNSIPSRPLPDDAYESLALIVSNANKLSQICKSIEQTTDFLSLKKIVATVAEKTGLTEKVANDTIVSLFRFNKLRSNLGLKIEEFIEWLGTPFIEFAQEQNKKELTEEWQKGVASIKESLEEGGSFDIMDKAIGLVYEHQNVLRDIRLLTDLRPVYDKDAKKILRMVVTHQLVLQYSEGSSDKRIYLAVDASDLKMLEQQCKRAREKATVASKSMEDCGWVTYIVGENDE